MHDELMLTSAARVALDALCGSLGDLHYRSGVRRIVSVAANICDPIALLFGPKSRKFYVSPELGYIFPAVWTASFCSNEQMRPGHVEACREELPPRFVPGSGARRRYERPV